MVSHYQLTARVYRPGDLVFVRPDDAFGAAIAACTGGPYSHVQIIVAPTGLVVEARLPRVRLTPADHTDPRHVVTPVSYLCEADRDAAVRRAVAAVGTPYSVASLVSDALAWLGFPLLFDRPNEDNCAELAALCIGSGIDPRGLSPNGLARLIGAAPPLYSFD